MPALVAAAYTANTMELDLDLTTASRCDPHAVTLRKLPSGADMSLGGKIQKGGTGRWREVFRGVLSRKGTSFENCSREVRRGVTIGASSHRKG